MPENLATVAGELNSRAVKKLLEEELACLLELVEIFRKEGSALIESNIDLLWKIADEKSRKIKKLGFLRENIRNLVFEEDRADIAGLQAQIRMKERELMSLRDRNRRLVEDSIGFLNSIITILAQEDINSRTYDRSRRVTAGSGFGLVRREV